MNLESILNNLITSGIKLSDPDIIRKYKVLNIFQFVIIMLAPILGLFYFYIGAAPLFYTSIAAGIFMIGGIVLLRMTKNIVMAGNYAVFILWAGFSIIAWNTGAITFEGVINPSWILNAGLILFAIFLNGYLSGTIWATIVFLETGVIIYLYRNGHQFPNLIPSQITATYFMGTYLVSLLALLLLAFLFEREKSEALIREHEKSSTIRESKRYMDDIFDRYPLPTFVLDRSHRVIQWNRACRELSGVPPEEILGKELWDGFKINDQGSIADIVIEDIDSVMENYSDSIVSQTDSGWFEIDTFLPKFKDGRRAIITAAPIFDKNGIVRGAIQTIQEVKKIATEGVVRGYLDETFPEPVFRIDSEGKINFWNEACVSTFGYEASRMLGMSPMSLVAKSYRQLFKSTLIKVLKGQTFAKVEWRYMSDTGKPIYVMARVFPSQDEDGEGMECVVVNTDITELRLKLKKISRYAAESNEKLKNLSEEHTLLKKNIATFIRKKDTEEET